MIPTAVAREIEGLLPVVAQNVEVTVETFAGVEVLEPVGEAEPRRALLARTEAGAVNPPHAVLVGDLLPGERRTIIARLRVSARTDGEPRQVLRARLTYQDPRGAGVPVAEELTLALPLAETESASAETVDAAVVGAARLAEILELAYLALLNRDRDLTESALREIAAARDDQEALRRHGEDETVREHAALFAHLGEELAELKASGAIHGHEESDPEPALPPRYLLLHHRRQAPGAEDR